MINESFGEKSNLTDSICYAESIEIQIYNGYTIATIRNPWETGQILQQYILVPKTSSLPNPLPKGTLIRTPLERTISYGSVQCSFFSEIDVLHTLIGVCEPQYIKIPFVQDGVQNGSIVDVGLAANPDVEKIMLLEPEAIFASPLKDAGYGQAGKLGIPFIECIDYMETTPLGRAEWIRFYGLLFDKKELADSLFSKTVNSYNHLKELTLNATNRPSVFTEMRYGNIWYLPGGNSYAAHLLRDAGADYCWKEDTSTGSLGVSFETVLDKAEKAQYWLFKYYNPQDMTYDLLAKEYANYSLFDAYKNRNIYVCNTNRVPYYEELPIHPDYVLKDMVWIFHPELLPGYQPRYYEKMKE